MHQVKLLLRIDYCQDWESLVNVWVWTTQVVAVYTRLVLSPDL